MTDPLKQVSDALPGNHSLLQRNEELERRVEKRTAELAESETKYRDLVEESFDVTCRVDVTGRILYISPQVGRYGFDPDHLTGMQFLDILLPDDRDRIAADFNKTLADGKDVPTAYRVPAPDGATYWFEERSTIQRGEGGDITGVTSLLRDITESKAAERKLRESEERYHRLFETGMDAIVVFDAETRRFVDVNEAARRLYGYLHEEFLGLKQGDITAEPEASDESIRRTLLDEQGPISLRWHRRKDGTVFPVEISPSKFTLNGRIVICGVIRDITKQEEVEKQIRFEQNLFHSLMDALPASVYFKDLDSRFIRVNQMTASRFEKEKEELIGKSDFDFFPEEVAKKKRADELHVLQTQYPIQIEEHHEDRWTLTSKAPRYDQNGELAGTFGVSLDITTEKNAQQNLEASRRLLLNILDTMHDRVWWKDLNSVFLGCNLNFAHDAGFDHPDQMIGKSDCDMSWKEQADHYIADDREVIESGKPKLGIQESQTQVDGSTRWLETNKTPLQDNEGRIIGTVGTYADITERKRAEQMNLEYQMQLRRLSARLTSAQDDEQRRIAEGLHDDVAQILAACSVKLALAGKAENMAEARVLHDETDELLAEANEKIRSLSFELSSSTLYRLGLREAVHELCGSMSMRYGMRFELEDDGQVRGLDETTSTMLFKAARELLFNVVKHAGVKQATVSICRADGNLKLMVEDHGAGFQNLRAAENYNASTGLGLFGIRERLNDMNGELKIESVPGIRTRVTLWVPTERDEQ